MAHNYSIEFRSAVDKDDNLFESSAVKTISSRIQFIHELHLLKDFVATENLKPLIKIAFPVSSNGFELITGETLNWSSFIHRIREINVVTRNQLILSLADEAGSCIINHISLSGPVPFARLQLDQKTITGEMLFEKLFHEYEDQLKDIRAFDKKVAELVKTKMQDPNIRKKYTNPQLRDIISRRFIHELPVIEREMKRIFLMTAD